MANKVNPTSTSSKENTGQGEKEKSVRKQRRIKKKGRVVGVEEALTHDVNYFGSAVSRGMYSLVWNGAYYEGKLWDAKVAKEIEVNHESEKNQKWFTAEVMRGTVACDFF